MQTESDNYKLTQHVRQQHKGANSRQQDELTNMQAHETRLQMQDSKT